MKSVTAILLPNKYKTKTSAIKGNKIVDALGIVQEKGSRKSSLLAKHALLEQADDLDVDIEIREVGKHDIPREINTDLVIFLSSKNFLPPKYLDKVLNAASIFSFAILCGPVDNHIGTKPHDWFKEDISQFYKSYKMNMRNVKVVDITDDLRVYPHLYNTVFTQKVYNEVGGYYPIKGSKVSPIWNNRLLVSYAADYGSIIYCDDLSVKYDLSSDELEYNSICNYMYKMGYLEGAIQPENKKEDVIWQKYVNNSERFDYSMPMWIAVRESIKDTKKKKEYAHKLAAFRSIYNIGFFEGIEGAALI